MVKNNPYKLLTYARSGLKSIGAFLSSQITWLLIFSLSSAGLVSTGAYILWGAGWGLIAAGAFAMFFAAIIFKGLSNG